MKQINNSQNALAFIDREDVRNTIQSACQQLLREITHFEVISIYGVGGIGKTQLLKEEFVYNKFLRVNPIYITLEITSKDDLLDILIKFRKALPSNHKYPLFDYAMLYAWNHLNVSKMDTDFLQSTKRNVIDFFKPFLDAALGPPTELPIGSIIEMTCNLSDHLTELYQNFKIKKAIDRIRDARFQDLMYDLPILLGADIHRAFLDDHFVLVIDSYKEYSDNTYSYSWLTTLVEQIRYGVFVITSREEISWPTILRPYVNSKNLNELPVPEVRNALYSQFSYSTELIENIIRVTDCMPIYLDLAVKALSEASNEDIGEKDIFFKSKEDIIRKFLLHLSANERDALIVLATIQIFDRDIFEYLVRDINLQVNFLSFDTICKRSLIRNYEYDSFFYKTHDVISENIFYITEKNTIRRIVRSYLNYICVRGQWLYSNLQVNMLLKHIISLYIKTNLVVTQQESEQILDLYFGVKESLLPFDCDGIDGFGNSKNLKDIYFFLCALSKERTNSNVRLAWLNKIDEQSCLFGKHLISLKLMKGYLRALCEGTQHLKYAVEEINSNLKPTDSQEWYYGQTKIFLGDCMVSYGRYRSGIKELQEYRKLIPQLVGKQNDEFQVGRHIGHAYRFNMMLDDAATEYSRLIYGEDIFPTALQKVYILTNLCETYCYFQPEKVIEIAREALPLSNAFKDLKSKGKIYYSLAIAWLHKKKFKRAKKYIRKSLYLNHIDGYVAGKLYAYMAQAYLEYAQKKQLDPKTIRFIKSIQMKIEVYTCFNLPIALMMEDYSQFSEIKASQEWLDFYQTAVNYRHFLEFLD